MQKKTKILLAIAVVLLVLLGLFASRSYLLNKFGITADIVTTEKLLNTRSVTSGDFKDDTLSNASVSGSAIRVNSPGVNEVCGSAPAVDPDLVPGAGNIKVDITEANPSSEGYNLYNYYLGADGTAKATGSTASLTQTDNDVSSTAPGIKVKRGNGWVYIELGKNDLSPDPSISKMVSGKITFQGVTIKANSIHNVSVEKISDGQSDNTSNNDEVSVNPSGNSVDFVLATKDGNDAFYINYCFSDKFLATGYTQGVIDLKTSSNLTRLTAETVDVNNNTSKMGLVVALSKDGVSWTDNYSASNSSTVIFQSTAYADTFCYRYVRYRVNLRTTDAKKLPGFTALNLYGGGACQLQLAASDVQCQDGKDNDGDGKTDYPDDPGCFSPMDDSEAKPKAICQDGTNENINLKIELANISTEGEGNLQNRIYVDSEQKFYKSGAAIPLVEDGVAIKDSAFNRDVPGVAVERGNGWVQISMYGRHRPAGTGKEIVSGKISFEGAGVKKVINGTNIVGPDSGDWDGPFESQGDGKYVLGDAGQDEFMIGESIPEALPTLVEFYSTVTVDIDSFYIYYAYTSKVGGGCQCQDKKDNDGDNKIDYPADPGCFSPVDNDETDKTIPNDFVPQCSDGVDNDGDGLIDFPDDPGCYSSKDNSETKPVAICQNGSHENMKVKVNIDKVENEGNGNMGKRVYVGDEDNYYNSGQWIDIVTDGVAKIDSGYPNDNVPGVQIQRGKGWIMMRFVGNHEASSGKEITTGSVVFEGTSIAHWLNGTAKEGGGFENQGNGEYTLGQATEDEFFIPIGGRKADFYTTATSDVDAMYIYYDYMPKTGGGCQCQDGIDNDGDGYIDYPNDPGCTSPSDESEIDNLSDVVKEPGRILPAAIKSGISFYIIIAIVLLIGGFVIYRIARNEPNEERTQPTS